ncbi:fimbrial protein [Enterobacterales bacterium CwR94]|nr:fimbrial protein [Enterobacterales bacterium CwR94]
MKKIIALSALAAMMATSAAHAASSGTITFNGELTATTCDASVDGKGPSATVQLPILSTSLLNAAGVVKGETFYNINLSNCAGVLKTASAYYEAGSTVDSASGRLKNTTGSASNVQLQLSDGSGAQGVIKVGDASQIANTTYLDVASGTAVLPYSVAYYATDATGPGTVVSSVVYSIQYK